MTKEQLFATIHEGIGRVLADRGLPNQDIAVETVLLGSSLGIDSLDLATVVIELTEVTGRDPFKKGFIEFRTVGELIDLFSSENGVHAK